MDAQGERTLHRPEDARLLRAVEAGDVEALRTALEDGANPNARKIITLQMTLESGETFEDTLYGESALALAIRAACTEMVAALVHSGADPSAELGWKIANWIVWGVPWSRETWDTTRYRDDGDSPVFPDSLAMALAAGMANFNLKGPQVRIVNPTSRSQTHDTLDLRPNLFMIRLLARHVTPTGQHLEIARGLANGVGFWGLEVDPMPEPAAIIQAALSKPSSPTSPMGRLTPPSSPRAMAMRAPSPPTGFGNMTTRALGPAVRQRDAPKSRSELESENESLRRRVRLLEEALRKKETELMDLRKKRLPALPAA